jgi:pimeloyl-ACP methyl ester carboxylesterase
MKLSLRSLTTASLGIYLVLSGSYLLATLPHKRPALPSPPITLLPAVLDTLLEVGGHKLHFRIWRGKTPVILFESGGGDDLSVWNRVLAPIQQATGATLITYDRAGFGTSEIDSSQLTIRQQIRSLKTGLATLGVDRKCLVVAHSLGGIFATALAAQYPTQVQGAVLLEATQAAFWTPDQLQSFLTQYAAVQPQTRKTAPGRYWMYATMPQLVA